MFILSQIHLWKMTMEGWLKINYSPKKEWMYARGLGKLFAVNAFNVCESSGVLWDGLYYCKPSHTPYTILPCEFSHAG